MTPLFRQKKWFPPFGSFSPRSLVALLLCGTACLTVTGALPAFFNPKAPTKVSQRTLSFAERVAYQRAIEEIYWRHRIWPKENPDPKPSLDAVMSQAQLEKKVTDYLRNLLVLENYWQKPITAQQLQAEMDRMARNTKQSEVLRELFEALGNDPAVIAECLARPILAERLIADPSAQDQTRHVEFQQTDSVRTMSVASTSGQIVYTLPKITDEGDPACTDNWTATTNFNVPSGRDYHTAFWTGSEMIIWGGGSNTGGRYNPSTDSWTATSTTNAPSGRYLHTAVWTGNEMIVWGGYDDHFNALNTGGRYSPSTNNWTPSSTTNAPSGRAGHTAVWTGSEMIVWGGYSSGSYFNTGGRYDPGTNTWRATSTTNAPPGQEHPTAVWTGSEMIVWGGIGGGGRSNTGGRYDPGTDTWIPTSRNNAPTARYDHTAVWTGSEMIVWGGSDGFYSFNNGGRYCAQSGARPTQLGNISTRAFVRTGNNVVIGGFIVQGTQAKRVIIRGIGPELTQYGVPNALANPKLELHDRTGALIASNDNWRHTIIGGIIHSDQVGDIMATRLAPGDGRESAIIADLPTGNYTAILQGVNNSTGVALVDVYDVSADGSSILGNISTRSFVQTSDNVMIGGFIVQGTQSKRVIIRAIGPELTQYGVPDVLADPTFELHDSTGALIASNDNWMTTIIGGIITSNQVQDIMDSGHAPTDPRESAIIAMLPSGNYTAIVRGVNNTTGIALVEVYDLDQ
jgi:hypothetical protein